MSPGCWLMVGVIVMLIVTVALHLYVIRAIRRAIKAREDQSAVDQVYADEGRDLVSQLVNLKKGHIELTGYIRKGVHDVRDTVNGVAMRSQANQEELLKDNAAIKVELGQIKAMLAEIMGRPPNQLTEREGET
jgi:hypothetical protein